MKIETIPMRTKAHPHAGLMMKYAEIAQTTDKPWEHFEVRRNKSAVWEAIYVPMPFYDNMEYRLKPEPPKTIRIGEYDVPDPVREPLEDDKEYWGVDPMAEKLAWKYKWNNALFCNLMLRRGLIHLTKEAAVIHAEALLSLTKAAEREKPRCPDSAPRTESTPHEIIQNLLTKGMAVWACVSDKSYDDARANIGRHAYRVTRCSTDSCYPVWTWYAGWKYAIPIDTATMTEITEVPK